MGTGRPVTLITGASAGIGEALAKVFAAHGHELVLAARREQALDRIADGIAATGKPRPTVLALDIALPGTAERIKTELAGRGLAVQYVVNNAGFGLLGLADRLDRAEQLAMIDLNVRALADLSLAFVDSLAALRGGVLNVASVAGFLPGPGMAVYYATKHFVVSFSESLHYELAPRGVRVTLLCPGPVPTEFQARAGIENRPSILDRPAEAVAQAGYRGLMRGRRLVVPGWPNWMVSQLPRFAPRALMVHLVMRNQAHRLRPRAASRS